ncbi:unnamed protein product [Lactuca saligna]|uniref:Uncharacterized protein n=1 Tax=Lactuca saligna TaxID=75948 RepID=A0AA36EHF7_LACSI|nr:unnamed protein product [Lactuca saligna]
MSSGENLNEVTSSFIKMKGNQSKSEDVLPNQKRKVNASVNEKESEVVLEKKSKVEFENCEVSVDSKYVHEMLGLPSGGSLLSNMDYISKNDEES